MSTLHALNWNRLLHQNECQPFNIINWWAVQTASFSWQNYTNINIRKRNNEMHISSNKHEICLIHKGRSRTAGYKFLTSALSSGHLNCNSSKLNNLSIRKGKIQVTCLEWKIAAPIYCSILNRRNGYHLSHHWDPV
jgi:predicted Zn-dependent protease